MTAAQFETAVATLDEAARRHSDNAELRGALLKARAEAIARLLTQADGARARGQWADAEKLLQRAAGIEPGNGRVQELLAAIDAERRVASAMARAEALVAKGEMATARDVVQQGLQAAPRHAGLRNLQRRIRALQSEGGGLPLLAEQRPITLDFRDVPLRTVLDAVTRHSGVSFVFDKDLRQDLRVSVYLRQVRVEEALDLIVSTHQLVKKVLDERTVLIYPNTPDKQREHQEQVVRAFHLTSGDVRQAAQLLRNVLRVKDPFVDERSNLLVLRESADLMQVAERLVALYDTADPEVTLELEVLEVNSSRLTEVGIKFPDTLTLTPLAAAAAAGGLTVNGLRELNGDRIGVSVAGLLLNLRREVGDFETLANPHVRIRNREKAKVLVGNKVPVVTTTASATGFVSDSVSYLDVGLKLDLEPTVHADDEVAIRVALEVSSLGTSIKTSSGTIAYQIVTRNASTVLRLRDGETQVLAGLVSREERSSASRLPGLGDIPVLGRLFSSQLDNGSRTELVLAITPRIVRNLRVSDELDNELWIGTETYTRLRAPGARWLNLSSPAGAAAAADAVVPAVAVALPAALTAPAKPAAEPSPPILLRWKLPAAVKVGEEFTAELVATAATPVRGANLLLQIRPAEATVVKGDAGSWWTADQTPASVTQAVDTGSGQWQLGVIRRTADGVRGDGVVATVRLKALKAGRLDWPLLQFQPLAAGPEAPTVKALPPLQVEVQ